MNGSLPITRLARRTDRVCLQVFYTVSETEDRQRRERILNRSERHEIENIVIEREKRRKNMLLTSRRFCDVCTWTNIQFIRHVQTRTAERLSVRTVCKLCVSIRIWRDPEMDRWMLVDICYFTAHQEKPEVKGREKRSAM